LRAEERQVDRGSQGEQALVSWQTLLVAFSRRMCCRGLQGSTKQRLPRGPTVSPAMRLGMRRMSFSRQAIDAEVRLRLLHRVCRACGLRRRQCRAPQSPGRFNKHGADRIERRRRPGAPASWAIVASVAASSMLRRSWLLDDDAGSFLATAAGQFVRCHNA